MARINTPATFCHNSYAYTIATPFFVTLAQRGLLDYPIFGLSLTGNASGSLSIGASLSFLVAPSQLMVVTSTGAVDSSVVTNVSEIKWNEVIPFPPFGSSMNTSSYLQWAIPFTGLSVSIIWVFLCTTSNVCAGKWHANHAHSNLSTRDGKYFHSVARRVCCLI